MIENLPIITAPEFSSDIEALKWAQDNFPEFLNSQHVEYRINPDGTISWSSKRGEYLGVDDNNNPMYGEPLTKWNSFKPGQLTQQISGQIESKNNPVQVTPLPGGTPQFREKPPELPGGSPQFPQFPIGIPQFRERPTRPRFPKLPEKPPELPGGSPQFPERPMRPQIELVNKLMNNGGIHTLRDK